jgi:hypothetical protein
MVYSSTMPPEPALRAFLDEEVIPLLVARFLREHGAANSRHERSEAGHARRAAARHGRGAPRSPCPPRALTSELTAMAGVLRGQVDDRLTECCT